MNIQQLSANIDQKLSQLEQKIRTLKLQQSSDDGNDEQLAKDMAALEKIDCFEKVEKGKISSVTAPPSGDNAKGDKPSEMKQFTLNINTTCP